MMDKSTNQPLFKIEPFGHSDIHSLSELQPSGWPDITPAFEFYTGNDFCFPLKLIINEKIVGTGAGIIHNDVAWLGHIIVHPANRNNGIGRLITQTLVDLVLEKRSETIYLLATDLGEPVYKKLGFETETEYLFFKDVKPVENLTVSKNIIPYNDEFKTQVASLDLRVSGEERMFHIERHLKSGYIYIQDNKAEGFYLPTLGEGSITAITTSAGLELMKARFSLKETACFPADNLSAAAFMQENNYKSFRTAKRMRTGKKRRWKPADIYNRIGGNLG